MRGGRLGRGWLITTAVSAAVVGVFSTLVAVGGTYAERSSDRLLPGTRIGGVEVGGLRHAEAVRLVREQVEAPLHEPVELLADDFALTTTAWELGLRVDVDAAVRKAMGQSDGNLVTKMWRRMFSHPLRFVDLTPKWDGSTLDAALERAAQGVAKDPQQPKIDASSGFLRIERARAGRALDVDASRDSVRIAAELGGTVYLTTKAVPPPQEAGPHRAILIRTGENKLYLYENGNMVKSWPVATGASGYATPVGQWQIVEKLVNPSWYNPGSSWARGMPAVIGPGPNNPLGTHALALDAPAILIHGTSDRASIGYNASHGCVRMLAEHEVELFERVELGTPVVVVDVAPAIERGSTPAPVDPSRAAAVLF